MKNISSLSASMFATRLVIASQFMLQAATVSWEENALTQFDQDQASDLLRSDPDGLHAEDVKDICLQAITMKAFKDESI